MPRFMKLFIVACTLQVRGSGIEHTPFVDVYTRFNNMCRGIGIVDLPSKYECVVMVERLASYGLIQCTQGPTDRYPTISVNVQIEDVTDATKEDPEVRKTGLFS